MRSGPNKTWRTILWGSSLPALLAASFLYFPWCKDGPVFCPIALIFGLPCPGCGLTRALGHATHGHLRESFDYHPIWPLIVGYFTFVWIVKIIETRRDEPLKLPVYKIGGTALIVLMSFWAIRLVWFFSHGGLAIMAHDNLIARILRLFQHVS